MDSFTQTLFVSPEAANRRLEICAECPLMLETNEAGIGPVCSDCGCLLPAIISLRASECPLGKWPVPDSQEN